MKLTTAIFSLYVLLLVSCGCAKESPAVVEADLRRHVESEDPSIDTRQAAMKPMLGLWVVDVDATVRENPSAPDDVRAFIRRDLEAYPFELRITEHEYISRSRAKINSDRYTVAGIEGGTVTIKLESIDRTDVSFERTPRLRLRNGKLLIEIRGTFTCVMSRPVNSTMPGL